jgi:NADPH:quinone reductase-like Zn-dependent oxidoreductase
MEHALRRSPLDICAERREERIIIGNAGVVRVVDVGAAVKTLRRGQYAMIFGSGGDEDAWGYPRKILGYDAPGTMGCLARHMKLTERQLVPIPEPTRHSLQQWAAFSVRYVTAWSNWEVARGVFRLLVSSDEFAAINVWGWGGGTTLAELSLARFEGCNAVMLSGDPSRFPVIERSNVVPLNRLSFGELYFDEARYRADTEYRRRYRDGEEAFLREVAARTDGNMVQIFVDMIGTPVYRATLRALSREGVITTAGWKEGMSLQVLRASECIKRHQHVFTHGARYSQGWKAVAFAEPSGWMPIVDAEVYSFDEIPKLAEDYRNGRTGLFPIFSINV